MTRAIEVALGARSYRIHIGGGLLADAGTLLAPFAKSRVAVITDENVAKFHLSPFAAALEKAELAVAPIVVAPGEQSKSFNELERLVDALLTANIERGGLVVALGGGVIGDLAGFAAGIFKRGVDYAQIPTTLLAQVDSSIGGKTAINTARGKNLAGLFYQPRIVIADTAVLATLPRRELIGGYAEIAKCGLLGDAEFFAWLEKHADAALGGDAAAMEHAVAHACAMKASIVARDEREGGERALLNLGHTFGHALEAATGYSSRLTHGEGVSIGCALAFQLSARLGLCAAADAKRVENHFKSVGLPTRISQIPEPRLSPDALFAHMRHDKKAAGGRMTFILAKGIGQAFVSRDVAEKAVLEMLAAD